MAGEPIRNVERLRAPTQTFQAARQRGLPEPRQLGVSRMSIRGDRMDAKPLNCSVCKHPLVLRGGHGRRRAALIEDGLTLCDVCAPSGNHQPIRFER
jgi:hypothetical protein